MKSTLWKRIFAVALAPILGLTVALAAGARPAPNPPEFPFLPGHALIGTWNVTVQQYACGSSTTLGKPFVSILTFNDGGTMVEATTNSAFAAGQRGDGQGTWGFEGRRQFSAKSIAFINFTTPANPSSVPPNPGFTAGTQTISQGIVLQDANSWNSDATIQFADTTGTIYRQGCAHATAIRFE